MAAAFPFLERKQECPKQTSSRMLLKMEQTSTDWIFVRIIQQKQNSGIQGKLIDYGKIPLQLLTDHGKISLRSANSTQTEGSFREQKVQIL